MLDALVKLKLVFLAIHNIFCKATKRDELVDKSKNISFSVYFSVDKFNFFAYNEPIDNTRR